MVPAAAWPERLQQWLPADVLLLGEQHDAPDHQRLQREAVAWLASRGQLAALVMEMAERGHSTQGLPRDASEAQARAALQWDDAAWPWKAYGPVVMAAVGAGVPVLGGNLPRTRMRAAMADASLDQHLPAPALAEQQQAMRDGHCGLLPESQIAPMARIQIARDASLAQTAQEGVAIGPDGAAGGRRRPCAAPPGRAHTLARQFGVKSGGSAGGTCVCSYQIRCTSRCRGPDPGAAPTRCVRRIARAMAPCAAGPEGLRA